MLNTKQIIEFAKWLSEHEPSELEGEDFWLLYAYRIVDYLRDKGVNA